MTDHELLTLCAFQEAANQTDDGVAAIVKVVLNRARMRYMSDGTIAGTIEKHDQFSWTTWDMVNGKYVEVAKGLQAELGRIQHLLETSEAHAATWARCSRIVDQVMNGSYRGADFEKLTDRTVLYANLRICNPSWLHAARFVCKIDAHSFYEQI